MEFAYTDDQQTLTHSVREFAQKRVKPAAVVISRRFGAV